MALLDLIFPKRCVSCKKLGTYICSNCFHKIEFVENQICPVCARQAILGKTHPGCQGKYQLDGLFAGVRYRGAAKAAIRKIKYKFIFDIAETLTSLLIQNLWRADLPNDSVIVPIPLHIKRRNWRGFNQSELMAEIIASKYPKARVLSLLQRVIETRPQVGLGRDDRRKNVRGVFSVTGKFNPSYNLVLFDDIYTSGATMHEAAAVLKKNGAKNVWAMVVALG